jgi:type VI secretion system FHA domain protein
MALRLDVISDQHRRLGERSSIVFGVAGGSIGRALDNDWVLPDAERFLSGHHARIQFRQGAFYLEDTSTNGVFVNDGATPLGRRGPHALRNGEVLRLGDYRVRVTIDAEQTLLPPPGTGTMSQMAVERVMPLRAVGSPQDDLGASLNIEALIPGDVTGSRAKLQPGAAGAAAGAQELSAQQRLTRLRAAARARLEGSVAPLADMRNGLQAFCRGAGIDPSRMPMESEARSLQLAGQLLREAILGLQEILRAQQGFLDHYRIEARPPSEGKSPLDAAADDYVLGLFEGHERRELDAVLQLRSHFARAGRHDSALDPALLAALTQFMAHLSPASIESRVRDSAGVGVGVDANWRRYKEVYGTLLQATGQELPHLFTEAVAQAYQKVIESGRSEPFRPTRE